MAASKFDTLGAARELEATGIGAGQAEAIVNVIRKSSGEQVTADQFDARFAGIDARFAGIDARFAEIDVRFAEIDVRFAELRAHIDTGLERQSATLHRALWLQGGAIVGVLAGLYTIAGAG